eukprot:3941441-Rhodomonas_salina.5
MSGTDSVYGATSPALNGGGYADDRSQLWCAPNPMSGTDITYMLLPAYVCAARCPVLTYLALSNHPMGLLCDARRVPATVRDGRKLGTTPLSSYARAMRSPVLTCAMRWHSSYELAMQYPCTAMSDTSWRVSRYALLLQGFRVQLGSGSRV